VRSDSSADNIDDPIISRDGFAVVRDVQGRLLRVVHEPEDDRVHIHRDGVFRQCLLGTKRRGLNPLIDHGCDAVDDRNDQEQSRPFDAAQFPRTQDDELFPGDSIGVPLNRAH
jgi:hypothetical protein